VITQVAGSSDAIGLVSPGIGLWISLAASVGILAFAWIFKSPGDTLQNGFENLKKSMSLADSKEPKSTAGGSKVDELERLIELKNQGKITDEEYQVMKSKIL